MMPDGFQSPRASGLRLQISRLRADRNDLVSSLSDAECTVAALESDISRVTRQIERLKEAAAKADQEHAEQLKADGDGKFEIERRMELSACRDDRRQLPLLEQRR